MTNRRGLCGALADAKAAGKDYLSQTETTVRAVRQVRPVRGDKIFAISRFRAIPTLTADRCFYFEASGL